MGTPLRVYDVETQVILSMLITRLSFYDDKRAQARVCNTVASDFMHVSGIAFDKRANKRITEAEWVNAKKQELLQTLTVGDFIRAYGEWPWVMYYDNHHTTSHKSLKYMRDALLRLGMTSQDWFLLEPLQQSVCDLHMRRCGGNKQKLKLLSILVLGFQCRAVQNLQAIYYPHTKKGSLPLYVMTIADILTMAYPEQLMGAKSLEKARSILRSFGFTEEDGPFLEEVQAKSKEKHDWRKRA